MGQGTKGGRGTVLVVEDEPGIREMVSLALEPAGYHVRVAEDGQEGLKLFFSCQPELVLLDIMMPKMDGWKLLERIREVSDVPVIVLTALGQESNRVRGLRSGADDYLVKPFSLRELVARVETVLRRGKDSSGAKERYDDGEIVIDILRHQVHRAGVEVQLSPAEFRLLAALVANAGMVMSTARLLDLCWKDGEGGPENVRVYIGYLRKKLGDDPASPRLIETVREFGYRYRSPGQTA